MKLYYTPTSPYARKARVAAIECGVAERLEPVTTTVRDPESPLLAINPVGMVPTLETDDGLVLTESALICDYLASLDGARPLLPADGAARWQALALEGTARGLLEGLVTWIRALRAPAARQDPAVIAHETVRAGRGLDTFEALADDPRLSGQVNLPQITLGCALGVLDFRLPDQDWRAGRPRLAAWYDAFAARPAMQATVPHA